MRLEPEGSAERDRLDARTDPTYLPGALAALSGIASRQRVAILARDAAALGRICEALARLQAELAEAPVDLPRRDAGKIAALARDVRGQIRMNQALIANGMAIADQYVAAVSEAAAACSLELFSGVA